MSSCWKSVVLCTFCLYVALTSTEGRPKGPIDTDQSLGLVESEVGEILSPIDDLSQQHQNVYPSMPLNRLQMLFARYSGPTSYHRSSSFAGMNELYRLPESKRQVRYRQCYFNPISCFKK